MTRKIQNNITSRILKERIHERNQFEGYVSNATGKSLAEILDSKGGK